MYAQAEIDKKWLDLKGKCDFYFSRIIGYPLCPPEHVYFSLTTRCNLRCLMCGVSVSSSSESDELTCAECKNVIDQVAGLGIGHLIFSGGEPLLRKDIFDLIEYAVSKNIAMVDIITNGLLIDEGVAKRLTRIGLNHITVSIDGLEDAHDYIRGEGSYQKAIRAIDFVNKYKKDKFPTVGINFTIMDRNVDHILPMVDLARNKKCNCIVFQPMLSDNTDMKERSRNSLWVRKEQISKLEIIIREIIELKKSLQDLSIHVNEGILKMIPSYFAGFSINNDIKCYEGIVRVVISHSGDLWTCLGKCGNLKRKSLRDCWFSGEAKKIRKQVKQCKNHCLQSCVFLFESSDIYSEAMKFSVSLKENYRENEYMKELSILFKAYELMLTKTRWKDRIGNVLRKDADGISRKEYDSEIKLISEVLKIRKD